MLICRRIEDLRIQRIDDQIGGAGVFVDVQNFFPRRAAVGRLENSALGVRTPEVACGRDVNDVVVAGIDHDARDRARILESHILPRPAAVGRLVDAVAP
jgi:hypothetical protein